MTELNRCVPDAWLGGASHVLPAAEPSDFNWPGRRPPAACSQMVCLDCKAEVKWQDGYELALDWDHRERVPQRALQMHTTDDWSKVDGIQVAPTYRLYTCRCFYHSLWEAELTFNPVSMIEENPARNLPWTCAGHPPLEAPLQVATIVEAAKDPARADEVLGLYWRTHHGSQEAVVPDALARAAGGPRPLVPALKSLFEAQTRLAPLSKFLEELIKYQRGISRPDPERRAQLVDVLTAAVVQRPSGIEETGTLEVLRDEALAGVTTSSQLKMLEYSDRDWLVAHVDEVLAKNTDHAGAVLARAGRAMLFGAEDPDAELRKLGTMARKTGVDAETLRAQAEAALGALVGASGPVLDAIKGA